MAVRVRPGSSRAGVGGRYGGALVVRVAARPVEGAATAQAVDAVAAAFGLRRADIDLVSGRTSRDKVLHLRGEPAALRRRLDELLGG